MITLKQWLCNGFALSLLAVACQPPATTPGSIAPVQTAAQIALEAKIREQLKSLTPLDVVGEIDPTLRRQQEQHAAQLIDQRLASGPKAILTGVLKMPQTSAIPVPLANHTIAVNAPDGSSLSIVQTDGNGQYVAYNLPVGMRLELVAYNSSMRSVARALVDVPLTAPPVPPSPPSQ